MIYCVEDERNIRELLIYTLETTGFSAKGVSNGKELRALLKEELPDLILLDIMLPGGRRIQHSRTAQSFTGDQKYPGDHGHGKRSRI